MKDDEKKLLYSLDVPEVLWPVLRTYAEQPKDQRLTVCEYLLPEVCVLFGTRKHEVEGAYEQIRLQTSLVGYPVTRILVSFRGCQLAAVYPHCDQDGLDLIDMVLEGRRRWQLLRRVKK